MFDAISGKDIDFSDDLISTDQISYKLLMHMENGVIKFCFTLAYFIKNVMIEVNSQKVDQIADVKQLKKTVYLLNKMRVQANLMKN